MADSIVSCKVYKNPDESVDRYDVIFEYDFELLPGMGAPTITIFAGEMVDPNDLVELKNMAVARAVESKQGYAHECAMIVDTIDDLNGEVTL